MSQRHLRTSCAVLALLLAASSAAQAGWSCNAKGLVSATYDGGDSAYVHLQGFGNGKYYLVERAGKVATGVTTNGTKFTCRER
jgi:hypothetical protein